MSRMLAFKGPHLLPASASAPGVHSWPPLTASACCWTGPAAAVLGACDDLPGWQTHLKETDAERPSACKDGNRDSCISMYVLPIMCFHSLPCKVPLMVLHAINSLLL